MSLKRILVLTAVLFVLVPVGITAFSANALLGMLQLPRTIMADWPGAQVVEIEARDHVKLKAAWNQASSSNGNCVLSLHGAGGWRARSHRFLPWLLPAGYSVLAPDLRAQGESGGDTITYGLLEQYDTLAWTSWMRGQGCTKIFGMGESLGASVMIMAAGIEPDAFAAIVAECPFANLLESAEERGASLFPFPDLIKMPIARMAVMGGSLYVRATKGLDFKQVSPVESIAKLEMPILLIHGLADTRTPPEHSKELLAANPQHAQLWLVAGAKHVGAFTMAPEEFKGRVLGLFEAR